MAVRQWTGSPSALGHQSILENAVLMAPAGVLIPRCRCAGGHMWDQYLSDLYWASKAVFGVACPVCRGVMTFVQVEPHPNGSGCELHTVKCQACGPTEILDH